MLTIVNLLERILVRFPLRFEDSTDGLGADFEFISEEGQGELVRVGAMEGAEKGHGRARDLLGRIPARREVSSQSLLVNLPLRL